MQKNMVNDFIECGNIIYYRAPERFVLALGCAGWGAGQIEEELKHNSWLVVDAVNAIVFSDRHEDKWTAAIKALGFDPSQLMGETGSA